MRETTWAAALLMLLAAAALTAGWAVLVEAPPHAAGLQHPLHESMQMGGSGKARHGPVLVAGWLLGLLVFGVIVALMAFAYRADGRLRVIGPWLAAAFALQALVYTAIMAWYGQTLNDPSTETIFGFPPATAWLLFALWPSTLIYVVIFLITFERSYWRPQDAARLKALIEKARS